MSEVLEYATDIPFWVNIFPTFLDIDKTTSFSLSPFPIAAGSLPPCPGSINTFLAPVTGGNTGSPSTLYSKLLNYEDAKCDITLCFIEIINKIPINKKFTDYKFILSYINKEIKNSYINISRNKNKIDTKEYICEIQDFNNKIDFHSDLEFYYLIKYLTDREKQIIIFKYFNCLSYIQISKLTEKFTIVETIKKDVEGSVA